jgi:hypothetical protein
LKTQNTYIFTWNPIIGTVNVIAILDKPATLILVPLNRLTGSIDAENLLTLAVAGTLML